MSAPHRLRLQLVAAPDIMRGTMKLTCSFLLGILAACAWAQTSSLTAEVETVYPDAHALYLDLHQTPELSSHEIQTATKVASKLRDLGYTVTEHVGGTGVVAILKNAIMAHSQSAWHGTLILIGQPAEETISGAKRMIEDGLMTRFPKPDIAVSMHVGNTLPAGQIGVGPGYRFSNADSLRITIYGKGGHGSMPNSTIDPIVIAAPGRGCRDHRGIHSSRHEKQHHS